MRLIDDNKLIHDIQGTVSEVCMKSPYNQEWFTRLHDRQREIIKIIENQPTVDAVPVNRCINCKYWGDEDGFIKTRDGVLAARCQVHNYIIDGRHTGWCPKEDDFCSYGAKEDG